MGRREKDLKLQERRKIIDWRSHSGNEGERREMDGDFKKYKMGERRGDREVGGKKKRMTTEEEVERWDERV